MTLRLRPLAALVLLLTTATAALAAEAEAGSPQAFLETIYRNYQGKDSKGFALDKPAVIRRIFVPELANAIVEDQAAAAKRGEVPELDGDPFVDAQDWEIAGLGFKVAMNGAARATATVTFRNFGEAHTVTHELVKTASGWRIADIRMKERTLKGLYPGKKK
jgi:hypothetical protein